MHRYANRNFYIQTKIIMSTHQFKGHIEWTGNKGKGTTSYDAYSRDHLIKSPGKIEILGSADPAFLGDGNKINPEDSLLNALSACHMLWYFHLCADAGVNVIAYTDDYSGTLNIENGKGKITEVTLNPTVTISTESDKNLALKLHELANEKCFIANSVNFPVKHQVNILQS